MDVKFYLLKERMVNEVDKCIALGRLDTLIGFCSSCLYKVFEDSPLSECHECKIYQGIKMLSGRGESEVKRSTICSLPSR
jgi:hypothetical protein